MILILEIDQRGHRGKYLLLEELRSPWDLSITSHESDCQQKTANGKLIIRQVMSFVCSDSYESGITKETLHTKGSGKLHFSEYLRFQSKGLEFSKCQILGQTCATIMIWRKKKWGSGSRIPRKDSKRMSMPTQWREFLGFLIPLPVHIQGGRPHLENSKLI